MTFIIFYIINEILDFDPTGDIIQPIGLYNNIAERRSIILFAKYYPDEDEWGFDVMFNGMYFENIYYVFSPSITPMPPLARIFKTTTKGTDKKYTEDITHILGIYDIKGIVANRGNSPSDVVFCTYIRKFHPDIVALNIFIDRDEDEDFSVYITKNENAFETPENISYNETPSKIFVMEYYPKGSIK